MSHIRDGGWFLIPYKKALIFEDIFKTFLNTFKYHIFCNLRTVCTTNKEQALGNVLGKQGKKSGKK